MSHFILEIYEPGDDQTVLAVVESDLPMSVSVGEFLHTGNLLPDEINRVLKVVRVEHTFWQSKIGFKQKRMVFTQQP